MVLTEERRRALTEKAELYHKSLDDVLPYLEARGISREAADIFFLGCVTDGEFLGRLAIPYMTPKGVVGFKYRCTDTDHGDHKTEGITCRKYMYEPGVKHQLFNAQALIYATDMAIVTEGELDAVTIQVTCELPAVGYPGTSSWQSSGNEHWPLCFEGIPEVVVIADGDDQGNSAAMAVAKSIGNTARVVQLGDGYDANSYIVDRGVYEFLERITE